MHERIQKIKVLVMDVDGVMTDGQIIYDSSGKETKNFSVLDGYGLVMWRRSGFKSAIITARASKVVSLRAGDLKIDKVYLDAYPKMEAYQKLVKDLKVKDEEVCFIGDDLPDMEVLQRVGFAVAVPNAVQEVKKIVHHITDRKGGEGAVREVIELILKTQGKWQNAAR